MRRRDASPRDLPAQHPADPGVRPDGHLRHLKRRSGVLRRVHLLAELFAVQLPINVEVSVMSVFLFAGPLYELATKVPVTSEYLLEVTETA